jgi:hypothetical protein
MRARNIHAISLGCKGQNLGRRQNFRNALLCFGHCLGEMSDGLPQCRQFAAIAVTPNGAMTDLAGVLVFALVGWDCWLRQ